MNRMARWMIRLYPASWRARYGDEMETLLSDTGADARIVGDLARGGMRMQLKAWPFPLLALVLGVAGLLLGAGISWLIPNTYASQATLLLENASSRASANEEIMRLDWVLMSRASLAQIIRDLDLYRDEQRVKPLEDVIDGMRQATRINLLAASGQAQGALFNIGFAYGDRRKAQETVRALVARLQEEASKSATGAGPQSKKLTVVDIANLPINPISPTRTFVIAIGFLGGLLAAVIMRMTFRRSWVRRRFTAIASALGVAGILFAICAQAVNLAASRGSEQAFLWANQYRSTATFVLPTVQPAEVDAIKKQVLSRTSLSGVVNDPRLRLYSKQQATTPLEDIIQLMISRITISTHTYREGTFVSLAFEYPDRFKAQQGVTALLARFREIASGGIAGRVDAAPALAIEVLDKASTPVSPVKPNRYLISGMGGFCGVFLAGIIWLLRRRWKPERQIPVNS
jgi:capsular polysaccharide biosynthesis protein